METHPASNGRSSLGTGISLFYQPEPPGLSLPLFFFLEGWHVCVRVRVHCAYVRRIIMGWLVSTRLPSVWSPGTPYHKGKKKVRILSRAPFFLFFFPLSCWPSMKLGE